MHFDISDIQQLKLNRFLTSAIAPRPIALVSTIDKAGNVNLSPFSFFNLVSYNPPIIIISVTRKVRDNTTKHTLQNVEEVPEVVVHIVDEKMVQQVSLASGDYEKGINEFIKAGFTTEPALRVKPPMVKESNIKLECKVVEIKALGNTGGAGNLIICEVLHMHINDSLLDETGNINQEKTEQVARAGDNWYMLADKRSMFKVPRPGITPGIGIDVLPDDIKNSPVLTGNHLAQLASVQQVPDIDLSFNHISNESGEALHTRIKSLIDDGDINTAWQVLLKRNMV